MWDIHSGISRQGNPFKRVSVERKESSLVWNRHNKHRDILVLRVIQASYKNQNPRFRMGFDSLICLESC